jgi:poly-gamma-glutamate synthesis protein (capsule biosynthesis protein)
VVALPPSLQAAADRESADVSLVLGEEQVVSQWIYALVAPFYEVRDGVSLAEAHSLWLGQPGASAPGPILILSPETYGVLARWWGEASPEAVQRLPAEELLGRAWETRGTWAIIPFEALEPRWKVLALEGQSPIRRDFEPSAYPLAVAFSLVGASADVAAISAMLGTSSPLPASNRVPDKLSVVALTGVTALVRATAWSMEQWGVTYPAQDIGDWLRQADITHISNEVPFAENCPYPNPQQVGVVFCSDPGYIALLEDVGTDVVELTGDHLHDWGPEAMLYTLGLYEEHGWPVYGGGANYEEGRQPVYMTHNGNRLAFIGCNGKGGSFARASETSPGSVACDLPWMRARITELASQGIVVIVTFQHQEHYGYAVPANFMADFQGVAEAGAAIVSGSQAHHPHGFEFRGDGLIHYGLGNLFFDQYAISPGTRQGFVDRHVIYDGRHISTELLTLVFVDFARSRPMNAAERTALLQAVFTASGW